MHAVLAKATTPYLSHTIGQRIPESDKQRGLIAQVLRMWFCTDKAAIAAEAMAMLAPDIYQNPVSQLSEKENITACATLVRGLTAGTAPKVTLRGVSRQSYSRASLLEQDCARGASVSIK